MEQPKKFLLLVIERNGTETNVYYNTETQAKHAQREELLWEATESATIYHILQEGEA